MTTTKSEEKSSAIVLKADVLGRVKTPAERREAMVDEFEKSGMSGQAFAQLVGMNYQTFATWVQKRRKKTGYYKQVKAKAGRKVKWLEAVVPIGSAVGGAVVIHLSGGVRVEASDSRSAIAILKELGVKGC